MRFVKINLEELQWLNMNVLDFGAKSEWDMGKEILNNKFQQTGQLGQ